MKKFLLLALSILFTACTPALPNPGVPPTQDPTVISLAAEATVTAMAAGNPTIPVAPTALPTTEVVVSSTQPTVVQPQDFWLTYLYKNKIYISNGDGSQISMVTNTPGIDYLPIWSPDGKNLAFIRFDGSNRMDGTLYILPTGSNTPRALKSSGSYGYFFWLPGSQEVVAISGSTGANDSYRVNITSGAVKLIAKNMADNPRLSPDGKTILLLLNTGVSCNGKGCTSPNDYHLYDIATEKLTQITGDSQPKFTLNLSPDGKFIAYVLPNDTSGKAEIIEANGKLVGSEQDLPWWTNLWRISPDGAQVAYTQRDTNSGTFDLMVRPVSGGEPRLVSHQPAQEQGIYNIDTLRWRPDGSGLIFNLFDKVYTVNLDGSGVRQIPVLLDNIFFDVRLPSDAFTLPASPTPPAAWKICPGALDTRLDIGRTAKVSSNPPTPNNVRDTPTKQGTIIGQIQPGEQVDILSGPVCNNGLIWWEIISQKTSLKGYTLEGDLKTYWLEPVE